MLAHQPKIACPLVWIKLLARDEGVAFDARGARLQKNRLTPAAVICQTRRRQDSLTALLSPARPHLPPSCHRPSGDR